MEVLGKIQIGLLLIFAFGTVGAQTNGRVAEAELQKSEKKAVTAVYGVTADDYLQDQSEDVYKYPKTRRAASRPSFHLPDAFYFIGAPIFLLILLRVVVIFLNNFEEKRKEEENQAASEHFNPD